MVFILLGSVPIFDITSSEMQLFFWNTNTINATRNYNEIVISDRVLKNDLFFLLSNWT